jgi:putative transposase
MALPKGSIVVFDRAYNDYAWFQELTENGVSFVTRMKGNARYRVVDRHKTVPGRGVTADQTIRLTGTRARECPGLLRRIVYHDPAQDRDYVFLTNHHRLSARTIADIYKDRWQIEIFFKCIKQNLRIKSFIGTSPNAVLSQIWVAMCVYLLLAFIKFSARLGNPWSQSSDSSKSTFSSAGNS